jgi:RNA polymerase sigma-70 factor (sigma-E family)
VDFEEFVAARGPALLRLALMLTGDAHLAQDLVQSTLASVFRHWSRVESADSPPAYVRQILVREHLSWRRRRSSGEIVGGASPAESSPRRPGADSAESLASRDAAWALLARLPRKQRAVLALRYYEDLSDLQIAAVLGCSAATVRSNAARALATLRTVLPQLDEELLP